MKIDNMNRSSEYNKEYVCTYSDPKPTTTKTVKGYKLMWKKGDNYYSILTGQYRYKTGPVNTMDSYSKVYEGTKFYNDVMVGKTAIFESQDDLLQFYPGFEPGNGLVVVAMRLSGELVSVTATNKYHSCKMYAGSVIDTFKPIL